MAKRGPQTRTANGSSARAGQIRCAIYTRKSTDEGLDQEFNSLDAQREACAAYVASQRHEGWTLVPEPYDDGGFTGGNMDRPSLRQLLADIEAGRVDVIVVYKVDRLTRSLADFAKIVEILEGKGASFVPVTQAFNTTTSMGRLTLNVLLSFAQFEREVTGERIRDKIAASKKKGMWMGGPVPMGYDLKERKLLINQVEADIVRLIFGRHVQLRSLRALALDLKARGIRSKLRTMQDGRIVGGRSYTEGALGYLLRNVLYIGKIRHGDQVYEGEHQAIISPELWEANQQLFSRASHAPRPRKSLPSPLSGFVEDALGRRMGPAHANKGNRCYRYYVSKESPEQSEAAWRIPALELETIVQRGLADFLCDGLRIAAALGETLKASEGLKLEGTRLAARAADAMSLAPLLEELDARIIVRQDIVSIQIDGGRLLELLAHGTEVKASTISIDIAVQMRRRGHELKLIYAAPEARPPVRDDRLIQLLGEARAAYQQLCSGKATEASRRHTVRLARLNFLAPGIVTAILEGRQPVELNARSLLRVAELPIAWSEQRRMLGFG